MLSPAELDHLNRQIAAMADYLARRGKRLNQAARDALMEAFRRQLRYRRLVEREAADPRQRARKDAA